MQNVKKILNWTFFYFFIFFIVLQNSLIIFPPPYIVKKINYIFANVWKLFKTNLRVRNSSQLWKKNAFPFFLGKMSLPQTVYFSISNFLYKLTQPNVHTVHKQRGSLWLAKRKNSIAFQSSRQELHTLEKSIPLLGLVYSRHYWFNFKTLAFKLLPFLHRHCKQMLCFVQLLPAIFTKICPNLLFVSVWKYWKILF